MSPIDHKYQPRNWWEVLAKGSLSIRVGKQEGYSSKSSDETPPGDEKNSRKERKYVF
jgi:hypothetical protein